MDYRTLCGSVTSAPAGAIVSSSRRTAAAGAEAPSSAQDRPPNAIALVVTVAAVMCLVGGALPSGSADKPRVSAGNGTLIIGAYPKQYWIIDEASEKIVGTIPYTSGIPRRTTLSRDGKRFYTVEAAMEKVEILDIAARKTIDTFTLSEGNRKVRIRGLEPDPLHRFVVMVTASATKLVDRRQQEAAGRAKLEGLLDGRFENLQETGSIKRTRRHGGTGAGGRCGSRMACTRRLAACGNSHLISADHARPSVRPPWRQSLSRQQNQCNAR